MELIGGSSLNIVEDGHLVSRRSDVIIYSVEAEYIDHVVKTYGPCNSAHALAENSNEGRCGGWRPNIL
jgi:prephenate dehydrogenase